jgi:4-amino-4-deoxy-L-arabinose transferase-like glycosyltransferase
MPPPPAGSAPPGSRARRLVLAGAYAAALMFTGFLLFYHLDQHPLWGDEAETATLARNVALFGVPQTFDGTNCILLHGTVDENTDQIWTWSPWLQEYLAAGSFLWLGPTTWAARAPFALIGWGCVAALALAAWKIYHRHEIALAAMLLLGTSEVFLLHARQCRYYPVAVLAEILFLYGAFLLMAQNRRGAWLAALALALQFYSNYIVMVANLPALALLAWMVRKQGGPALLRVAAAAGLALAAALPWILYAHQWKQGAVAGGELQLGKAWGYLAEFHFHFLPLCFLLLPLLKRFLPATPDPAGEPEAARPWENFLLLLLGSYSVTILLAPGFYLRYLLPVLPVACLLAAAWVFRSVPWRALAVALIAGQILSNAFAVVTAYPVRGRHHFRLPLVEYVRGLVPPYADRFTDVLDYLKPGQQPGKMVLSFDPEFPLMFYTPLTVVDANLMGPAQGRLPDWIFPLPASGVVAQPPAGLPDFLKPHYETVTVDVHDSPLGDGVPEPDLYLYQTATHRRPFVIYRLKANP